MFIVSDNGMKSVNTDQCCAISVHGDLDPESKRWYVDAIMRPTEGGEIRLLATSDKDAALTLHKFILARILKSGKGVCFVDDIMSGKNVGPNIKEIVDIRDNM